MLSPLYGSFGALGAVAQRPSVWTPRSISGLEAWYKADAITGLANGAAVSSWPDSSGKGRHATQPTVSRRPTYQTAVLNGNPTVRLATANAQCLSIPGLADALSLDNTISYFMVVKPTNLSNYPVILTYPYDTSSWLMILEYDTNGGFYVGLSGSGTYRVYNSALNTTNWFLGSIVKTSSSAQRLWKGGVEVTTYGHTGGGTDGIKATPVMSGPMQLGGYASASYGLTGDIAEFLAYSSAPSDADRQKIEGYLAHKYGLTSQLPSGHPYKSVAP